MKKEYIIPTLIACNIQMSAILSGSDLNMGGTEENGSANAKVLKFDEYFDDDEDGDWKYN